MRALVQTFKTALEVFLSTAVSHLETDCCGTFTSTFQQNYAFTEKCPIKIMDHRISESQNVLDWKGP